MNIKYWIAAFCLYAIQCQAEFTIDNPLNFGEIAIRGNSTVSSLSIGRNGSTQSTGEIYIIKPGSPGTYTLSNFPPYTNIQLSVDLPAYSAMMYSNTAQFVVNAVDMPTNVNIDASGNGQFKIGATLNTSGNPAQNYYSGANYVIYLNLNINY